MPPHAPLGTIGSTPALCPDSFLLCLGVEISATFLLDGRAGSP